MSIGTFSRCACLCKSGYVWSVEQQNGKLSEKSTIAHERSRVVPFPNTRACNTGNKFRLAGRALALILLLLCTIQLFARIQPNPASFRPQDDPQSVPVLGFPRHPSSTTIYNVNSAVGKNRCRWWASSAQPHFSTGSGPLFVAGQETGIAQAFTAPIHTTPDYLRAQ